MAATAAGGGPGSRPASAASGLDLEGGLDKAPALPAPVSDGEAARAFRYPVYKPDKFCVSAAVPPPPYYVRRVGRMYVLREHIGPDGLPRFDCIVGPCWPMIFVTPGLIIGTSLAVYFGLFPDELIVAVLFPMLVVFVIVAYFLTSCRDPGIQRRYTESPEAGWLFSEQGQTYRPPDCKYEAESQVVIKDIDHLCPWTGTIIAAKNMRVFRVFTSSLCALIFATILLVILHFV
mmetsp:Transcript_13171/g.41994  ORF Transcript_13171/g.41994 Transcript_13171/m.41994 type:complete len:233 (+) Transcript_13171:1266-1964(+)